MSVQEIEQAITHLSASEVKRLAAWLESYRARSAHSNGVSLPPASKARTLADTMGDLLGAVGRDKPGSPTSSRDAGQSFTDHLAEKKREHRL
jgi:hypothetical protein